MLQHFFYKRLCIVTLGIHGGYNFFAIEQLQQPPLGWVILGISSMRVIKIIITQLQPTRASKWNSFTPWYFHICFHTQSENKLHQNSQILEIGNYFLILSEKTPNKLQCRNMKTLSINSKNNNLTHNLRSRWRITDFKGDFMTSK